MLKITRAARVSWSLAAVHETHKRMSDSNDFTPKEQFQISLFKDPEAMFSKNLIRSLSYLLPSLGLVAYSLVTGKVGYGVAGYGVLLFQSLYRLSLSKRALRTICSIIRKYEAKIQSRHPSEPKE